MLCNHLELNDFVRDLYLPKQSVELLASRSQEKQLLHSSTSVTFYLKTEQEFMKYFTTDAVLVQRNKIKKLI